MVERHLFTQGQRRQSIKANRSVHEQAAGTSKYIKRTCADSTNNSVWIMHRSLVYQLEHSGKVR